MILKMRTRGDKKGQHVGWIVIDDVARVDYKYIDEPESLKSNNKMGITYVCSYPGVADKRITEMVIYFKNGNVETTYTDDAVYILNDNGKTCDTINV